MEGHDRVLRGHRGRLDRDDRDAHRGPGRGRRGVARDRDEGGSGQHGGRCDRGDEALHGELLTHAEGCRSKIPCLGHSPS